MSSDNGPFDVHAVDPARLSREVRKTFGLSARPVGNDWDMTPVDTLTIRGKEIVICTINDDNGPGWCWAQSAQGSPGDKKIYSSRAEATAAAKGWRV